MIADTNLKSYFLEFTEKANREYTKHSNEYNIAITNKENLYNYIIDNQKLFNDVFKKPISKYPIEMESRHSNPRNKLYNDAVQILNTTENAKHKAMARDVIKYVGSLSKEESILLKLNLSKKKIAIKHTDFTRYVNRYYNEVHKRVLHGDAYKFSNGIGLFMCNRWKMNEKFRKKKILDFKATNENKRKRIAEGKPLYCVKSAKWHADRGTVYPVEDHRVFRSDDHFYEFTIIKSKIIHSSMIQYERTEYVSTKYRGMSYKEMGDVLCKRLDDVYDLQVDIGYKLNILLYKDSTKYLNFIRNAEQLKYKRGAHSSYNRQQLQS